MADYRKKRWRSEMAVRVDVNGALAALAGDGGVSVAELEALAPLASEVHEALESRRRAKDLRFRDLPQDRKEIARIVELAGEVATECETLVVLGIGASALGARALYSALKPPFHAHRPGSPERGARLIVADNVDPRTFGAILDDVDPHKTVFNVISKSGETAETMAQFLIVRERLLKVLGAVDYTRHLVITTDAMAGALRQIVNDEGLRSLAIPSGIGGRYSVLSAVGLFPAAVAGIDPNEVLAGAAEMDARCASASIFENPAYLHGAVHHVARVARGRSVRVTMPYADALGPLADWFAQLWAESLGKKESVEGRPVVSGQTPVTAIGSSDQHTQLQLWTEGPDDKIVTFLRVEDPGARVEIPNGYGDLESVGYLGGRSLGDLLNLEQRSTELALARRGRPSTTIQLPAVNGFTLGQLFMMLEIETVFAAGLAGVNPFDQPGIEEGKRITWALAGRKGFEDTRAEVAAWLQRRDPRFVV